VLLVDDDDAVFEYLNVKLGGEFELVGCTSADQALSAVRSSRPDLVLCDVDLPGMDGGDLSALFFADGETRDIPFLFLTALLSPADLQARGNQLALRFRGTSWVEVRDRSGSVVLSMTGSDGATRELLVSPPGEVIVGNAGAIDATWRGRPIDVMAQSRQNVARIKLD